MNAIENARAALMQGKVQAALDLLENGGQSGDPRCWAELAFLHLQGRSVPRDLARSRSCFRRAAELGDDQSRRIYIALVGNGTGGPSDFAGALRMLETEAAKFPDQRGQLNIVCSMDIDAEGDPRTLPSPRHLSESPQVLLFPELLSAKECLYLAESAAAAFRPAPVGSVATGTQGYSGVRTCDFASFPWVAESPAIHAINRRIAAASGTGVECGEPLQILRYRPGQEFKPHRDCTESTDNQRVLTMLVYLNEDYAGGETHFLANGLKVRGRTGDGLLFRNANEQGHPDANSLHAGLPVTAGQKLVASRWIRQKRYGPAA